MTRQRGPAARGTVRALGDGSPMAPNQPLVPSGAAKPPPGVSPALCALSERQFQAIVVAHLRARRWIVWTVPDMRKTAAGLPDIIALGPVAKTGPIRLLMWELKAEKGRVRLEQRHVIECLAFVPGIDARIVRPSDWPALRDALLAALLDDDGPGEGE